MNDTDTALADAARAALDAHPTLDVHAAAVDALAEALDALVATNPPDDLPTADALRDALDGLETWLNARRRDPLRSLGGFLGAASRSESVRDAAARGWLELATGTASRPTPRPTPAANPPGTDAEFVRDIDPRRNVEAEIGRHAFQLHHIERTLEAVLDLLDDQNRERSNAIAEARKRLRAIERARGPFVA